MKKVLFATALLLSMMGAQFADAQSRTVIVRKEVVQNNNRGRISAYEARQIQERKTRLRMERRLAMRDGWISPAEQRRLDRMQQQLDLYVFQQSRDRRVR